MKGFDHWNRHVQQWRQVGTPLKPTREDIDIAERAVRDWCVRTHPPHFDALLLGVTPEIALMEWPAGARLLAVDRSQTMIDAFFPKPALPASWRAHCGEWHALPVKDASQHVVIGDGCFSLFTWPAQWQTGAREIRRVLHDEGMFIMRFFVRPEISETVEQVFDDLHAGRIGNFHVFKWRLAMALHGGVEQGVRLADVWDAWHAAACDVEALAKQFGWSMESIRTIEVYRDVPTLYIFSTLAEARAGLAPYFEEVACIVPEYELGARCPTLLLKPK